MPVTMRKVAIYRRGKEVEVDAAVCDECKRYDAPDEDVRLRKPDPKRVMHDALCTERLTGGEPRRPYSDYDRIEILTALHQRASVLLGAGPEEMRRAVLKAFAIRVDGEATLPRGISAADCKGMLGAPFFTETYLYPLLGKDAARTVLAVMNAIATAAGLDWKDIGAARNTREP